MKKIMFLPLLFVSIFLLSGCTRYFTEVSKDKNRSIWFGKFKTRDTLLSDVTVYRTNSDIVCNGTFFLLASSQEIKTKATEQEGLMKLGCSDGLILNMNWKLQPGRFIGKAEGFDQFNNKYEFQSTDKEGFKSLSAKRIGDKNDQKEVYLKH